MDAYQRAVNLLVESFADHGPITYSNNSGPHYMQLADLYNHARNLALEVQRLGEQVAAPTVAPASDNTWAGLRVQATERFNRVRELLDKAAPAPALAPISDDLQVLKANVEAVRELLLQALKGEGPDAYFAAVGNAFVGGIRLYGPFPYRDDAINYAEKHATGNGWEVVVVNKPED